MGSSREKVKFSAHSKWLIHVNCVTLSKKCLFVHWPKEPNVYGIMLNMIRGDSTKKDKNYLGSRDSLKFRVIEL